MEQSSKGFDGIPMNEHVNEKKENPQGITFDKRSNKMKILVTGSSGFIGHYLVRYLQKQGNWVRGVDWKKSEYSYEADEFLLLDLRLKENAEKSVKGMNLVYALAADMGGMGFIQAQENQALILYNNTMINFNTINSMKEEGINKGFYSSSACVYPNYKQNEAKIISLKEFDAYPAEPQDTYGWEKLQAEHLVKSYNDCYGMDIKIGRFHNIYGPEGSYDDGREKAPAAICRKVITAKNKKENFIEIWGDGTYIRSFCYIDDCLNAIHLLMDSDCNEPVNIGRDDGITINDLAKLAMKIGNVDLDIKHIDGPLGVKGRNSDNTLFKSKFGWVPEISIEEGLAKTYSWIESEIYRKQNKNLDSTRKQNLKKIETNYQVT